MSDPGATVANPLGKPPLGAAAMVTTVRATRALSVIPQEAGVLVVGSLPFARDKIDFSLSPL